MLYFIILLYYTILVTHITYSVSKRNVWRERSGRFNSIFFSLSVFASRFPRTSFRSVFRAQHPRVTNRSSYREVRSMQNSRTDSSSKIIPSLDNSDRGLNTNGETFAPIPYTLSNQATRSRPGSTLLRTSAITKPFLIFDPYFFSSDIVPVIAFLFANLYSF